MKHSTFILPSHRILYLPIILLFLLSFTDCAKKGSPTGGPKDSIPPIIVRSVPENYTTNFDKEEIKIYFDEFIKLKDLNQNLLISPPFEVQPTITPISTSKVLKIVFNDTLQPNTTYAINFGQSIEDNNEGNPFDYFTYVFSTGPFIDSLQVRGTIKDALLPKIETPITVGLYAVDSTTTDSIIYNQKPRYITTVRDSSNIFTISNVKEGNYTLVAFQEKNANYTYQPSTDKIGYFTDIISVPTDSSYSLTLFKETPDFKMSRPKQVGQGHILFGYEGEGANTSLEWISEKPDDFRSIQFKDHLKDTLHYWFSPKTTQDSIQFLAKNESNVDTLLVRMKELYKDTLVISSPSKGTLTLKDTFFLASTTPLLSVDSTKVLVTDKDTLAVDARLVLLENHNRLGIAFNKKEEQKYAITVLPDAVTDFYKESNKDTLKFSARTLAQSDYGSVALTINNRNETPLLVEITTDAFKLVERKQIKSEDDGRVVFENLMPGMYYIRVIKDKNGNNRWDTGSYLRKRFPEEVVYYPTKLEVKANWYLEETFTLE